MTLQELIQKAKTENKWLHCSYQDLWFSPSELEQQNRNGKFNWSPENFSIEDPQNQINNLIQKIKQAEKELSDFRTRLDK